MQLTKYEHACLDIKEGDDRLIIDPGEYSKGLVDPNKVVAIVITHVHGDHFDESKVQALVDASPTVKIFTTQEVADRLANQSASQDVTVVRAGQNYTVGPFKLEFFGGQHATIWPGIPVNQNIGVLVNDKLYYPGDSLTPCPKPHATLAAPIMAPWLKFSETADFIAADSAQLVFPTHNGFINPEGQRLFDRLVDEVIGQNTKSYRFLAPGETLNLQ